MDTSATFTYWSQRHMHTKKTHNPYLIYVVAVHPVSCKSIWTWGALEAPRLGADAHVLSETGPVWALSQRLRLHDKLPGTRNWTCVGWTSPETCGHTHTDNESTLLKCQKCLNTV